MPKPTEKERAARKQKEYEQLQQVALVSPVPEVLASDAAGAVGKYGCTEADLAALRGLDNPPLDSLGLDDFGVRSFAVTSDLLTQIHTRFRPEHMEHIAELLNGRPVMINHELFDLARGRWILPQLVHEEVEDRFESGGRRMAGVIYARLALPMPDEEDLYNKVASGIVGVSIGVHPTQWTCGICGQDYRTTACSHLRGEEYNGRQAFVWWEMPPGSNAYVREASLAWDGAASGSGPRGNLSADLRDGKVPGWDLTNEKDQLDLGGAGLNAGDDLKGSTREPDRERAPDARGEHEMEWNKELRALAARLGLNPDEAGVTPESVLSMAASDQVEILSASEKGKLVGELEKARNATREGRLAAFSEKLKGSGLAPAVLGMVEALALCLLEPSEELSVLSAADEGDEPKKVPVLTHLEQLFVQVADLSAKGELLDEEALGARTPDDTSEPGESVDPEQALHEATLRIQADAADEGRELSYEAALSLAMKARKRERAAK